MAYLIADSGSTKTEWLHFDKNGVLGSFHAPGFNSDIMPWDQIRQALITGLKDWNFQDAPSHVFFYAASMANPKNVAELTSILKTLFPGAHVEVEHDLLAAARALCLDEPGIACILGTGSNSASYDGNDITHEIGGQGYLFGDEGSGSDIGKALIGKMLNGYFSDEMVERMETWAEMKRYDIRKSAYQSPRPNAYLSTWSRFAAENITHPEVRATVKGCFGHFLKETVLRYPDWKSSKVNFVGSVGFSYSDILREACAESGVRVGRILKSPMEGLHEYHLRKI